MKDGLIKAASASPKLRVADTAYNADQIVSLAREAAEKGVCLLAFPELCITGSSCGDLFLQGRLLEEAKEQLWRICAGTGVSAAIGFAKIASEP